MTQIKTILTGGLVVYLAIAIWQVLLNPGVAMQAAGLGIVFIVLTGIAWISDETRMKQIEMGILWICIGLFALYAILVAGGVA